MKTTLRGFIFVLLAVAGGMTLLMANAQGTEDALPPEVKALAGMKIQPKVVGEMPARIPNFIQTNGAMIVIDEKSGNYLGYSEGFVSGKWPVFFTEHIHPDKSIEILEVQMLPANLIDWKIVNGKRSFLEWRYTLSEHCRADEEDTRLIFGLIKQEEGKESCAHYSSRVKRAWQIDRQSGHITPLPIQGLQCYYIAMDNC